MRIISLNFASISKTNVIIEFPIPKLVIILNFIIFWSCLIPKRQHVTFLWAYLAWALQRVIFHEYLMKMTSIPQLTYYTGIIRHWLIPVCSIKLIEALIHTFLNTNVHCVGYFPYVSYIKPWISRTHLVQHFTNIISHSYPVILDIHDQGYLNIKGCDTK